MEFKSHSCLDVITDFYVCVKVFYPKTCIHTLGDIELSKPSCDCRFISSLDKDVTFVYVEK